MMLVTVSSHYDDKYRYRIKWKLVSAVFLKLELHTPMTRLWERFGFWVTGTLTPHVGAKNPNIDPWTGIRVPTRSDPLVQ